MNNLQWVWDRSQGDFVLRPASGQQQQQAGGYFQVDVTKQMPLAQGGMQPPQWIQQPTFSPSGKDLPPSTELALTKQVYEIELNEYRKQLDILTKERAGQVPQSEYQGLLLRYDQAQSDLKQKEIEIQQLQSDIKEERSKVVIISELRHKLEKKSKKLSHFKGKVNELNREYLTLQRSQHAELKKLQSLPEENRSLSHKLKEQSELVQKYESEISIVTETNQLLHAELGQGKVQQRKLEQRISELESEREKPTDKTSLKEGLSNQLTSAQQRVTELQLQLEREQNLNEGLDQQLQRANDQIRLLQESKPTQIQLAASQQNRKLHAQINILTEQNTELEQKWRNQEAIAEDLQRQYDQSTKEKAQLESNLLETEKRSENANQNLSQQSDELKRQVEVLRQQGEEDHFRFQEQLKQVELENLSLKDQRQERVVGAQVREKQLEEQLEHHKKLNREIMERLQATSNELKAIPASQSKRFAQLQEEIDRLTEQNTNLQNQLEVQGSYVEGLRADLNKSEKEKADLGTRLIQVQERLNIEKKDLAQRIETLQQQLERKHTQAKQLQGDKAINEERMQLREQLAQLQLKYDTLYEQKSFTAGERKQEITQKETSRKQKMVKEQSDVQKVELFQWQQVQKLEVEILRLTEQNSQLEKKLREQEELIERLKGMHKETLLQQKEELQSQVETLRGQLVQESSRLREQAKLGKISLEQMEDKLAQMRSKLEELWGQNLALIQQIQQFEDLCSK